MRLKNMYKRNKIVRWYKFKKKIYKRLPRYNTWTGEPIRWRISIFSSVVEYCATTGKPIREKHPVILIEQIRPVAIVDPCVYKYNYKNKSIRHVSGASWTPLG